jgi:hypothetical protein
VGLSQLHEVLNPGRNWLRLQDYLALIDFFRF